MAINLTNLFTGLGKFYKILYDMHGFSGSTLITDIAALATSQGATYPDLCGPIKTNQPAYQSAEQVGLASDIFTGMTGYLLQVVNAAVLQPNNQNVTLALGELYREMVSQSYKVSACTLGATPTAAGTNTGTGIVVCSTKRGDGLTQDNMFAETGFLVCTSDAQHNTGTAAGQEPFTYSGEQPPLSNFGYDFPGASGATANMSVIDSQTNAFNILINSDFETFTVTNTPDSWTLGAGTVAGTEIFKETTGADVYRGTSSVKLLGTGSTSPSIYQPVTLQPNTIYAVNVWIKANGSLSSTGTVKITLADGSLTTITDDQGAANGVSVALTALTTSFANYSGILITPKSLPSVVNLRFEASHGASLLNTEGFWADTLALAPMTFLYQGGPAIAIFAGSTPFQASDYFTIAFTNNQNSANYGATIQRIFDRAFSTRQLGFLLPTTGSTLLNDSLFH